MRNLLRCDWRHWSLGTALAAGILLVGSSRAVAGEPFPYAPAEEDVLDVDAEEDVLDVDAEEDVLDVDAALADQASFVTEHAAVTGMEAADVPSCTPAPQACCDMPLDQLFRLRGGLSYYDHSNIDSKAGGTYGLDGVLPMTGDTGGYAAAKANHVSGGSQYYTSLGLYKMADICDDSFGRVGGAFFYDYFADSRGDIDLTMYRFYLGYAVTEDWSVGLRHIEPGEDDTGAIGSFFITQSTAVYASGYVDDTLLTAAFGYRDDANTTFLEAAVRTPVACNLYAFVDTHYEDRGTWVALTGLEFRFGPGGSGCGCNSCSRCCRTPWDDPTIAESFNWGEAKTFGAAVDVDDEDDYRSEEFLVD